MPALKSLAFASLLAVTALSCNKPAPPQIVVEGAKVTNVGLGGVELAVHVAATNPNGFSLTFRSITANTVLAGKYPLGQSTLAQPVSIPANQTTKLDVPLVSAWADLTTLGMLATSNDAIPYTVQGTFAIGGETLNVTVPFSAQGTITRDLIVKAAAESTGLPLFKK